MTNFCGIPFKIRGDDDDDDDEVGGDAVAADSSLTSAIQISKEVVVDRCVCIFIFLF